MRNDRIEGIEVQTADGVRKVKADLVVACDGRHSILRQAAGLPLQELGVPIDVLWFRIRRSPSDPDPNHVIGNINYGKILILIDRGDYFQAGMIIRKGSFAQIQQEGLAAFRTTIARVAPNLRDRVGELETWEQVKLLSVQINRLRHWHRPGLLCIGDAAHAMSPAFGVGINLAIQDAVATARIVTDALRRKPFNDAVLHEVQLRRQFPTRVTQFLQVVAHQGIEYVFDHSGPMRPPIPLKLAVQIPGFQRAVARVVGIGIRPEHVAPPPLPKRRNIGPVRRTLALAAGIVVAAIVLWRRTSASKSVRGYSST